ncbi:filamentous hemagglutinin N-terminal domain-containing protein [Nostoc sp. ChiQUE01b]|uniref:two-partner secretion domain-containing protein n=1 Tax=Nostoc sp. ChiQUE01b TaxID=3075376 RepID=UPI002AD405D4|nr:filamentous hemagglutinin N-terminal domain-containing protein [Nostoc sp. ChiQUE01b]MDZ8263506.1 filamentous hemagglutinin N-terminal domain-containing protein [Nostoc sp. ChiQUE01b]
MSNRWSWFIGIAICGSSIWSANCALAEELKPIPDNTLGAESSLVTPFTPDSPVDVIDGGAQRGANLFHSFREFNVAEGRGAYFYSRSANIQNILARVTGGNPSKILGTIGTFGNSNPNLFLINPSGIIFGRNASLNIGGSFVATTANALQFGNIGFFSATEKNIPSPLLTINPSALLFNQINKNAGIQNSSVAFAEQDPAGFNAFGLRVPNGKSLLLVGGNVSMDGGELNAFGGRVELGGLAEPGSVALSVDGDNLSLGFSENVARTSVSLTNQAGIYVQGAGGGNIAVNASNLEILGGSYLSGGIGQGLGTPETVAGDITLNATEEIKVAGGRGVGNLVRLGSLGDGGNITIDSGSFSLRDRAQIAASTFGKGNAGDVTVSAKNAVDLLANAAIFSTVEAGGVGKGGNININAATLSLIDGAGLIASTSGQGNAGNVTVSAKDAVSLADSDIFSRVESGGVGKGGNIGINAATLSLIDGAQLQTITSKASATAPAGQGDAGNVNVNVTGKVDIAGEKSIPSGISSFVDEGTVGSAGNITINSGSFSLRESIPSGISSFVDEGTVGSAGNITINSGSFSLRDGAELNANTRGRGNAGSIVIQARDTVSFDGQDSDGFYSRVTSQVGDKAVGNGGSINITTGSLLITNSARLSASTLGEGNASNVNIFARDFVFFNGVESGVFSIVGSRAIGNGGNITIDSGTVSLNNGATLATATQGQGRAGNITVRARDSVSLAGSSTNINTAVGAGGVGKGGNLDIKATSLSLNDSAQLISAISTNVFDQPAGQGDAGNINIEVTDSVRIVGINSGIFSLVSPGGIGHGGNIIISSTLFSLINGVMFASTGGEGNGGNIALNANRVEVLDGGQLSASTFGQGNAGTIKVNAADFFTISGNSSNFNSGLLVDSQSPTGTAGDIIVTSPRVTLDNSGILNARSASGNGGNINLQTDLLLLHRGASISTTAGTEKAGGNGGNITINAPSGFIVAVPKENSDITANAYTGSGGRVNIQAIGIYGIQPRSNPTFLSDITASSEFGVSGTVELNTPDVDLNSGLVNLPSVPVDTQVAQTCQAGGNLAESSFTITGRGGLPPNPGDVFNTDAVEVDWVTLNPNGNERSSSFVPSKTTTPAPEPIIEATGLALNEKGEVVLTANLPSTTPHSPWLKPASCRAIRNS